jgi:hypothetical protein
MNSLLYDYTDFSSNFALGYWTTNGTHAIGHEGSTVYTEVMIKDEAITGDLNFTIFNPNGQINPLKIVLPSNLSYYDSTSFTKNNIPYSEPGVFSSTIVLDPSVYNSDLPGNWTAFLLWQNGTEVGLFTQTIIVQRQILLESEWESLPDSNEWTSDTNINITRINGDYLKINASTFSISEPFFEDSGNEILNANISYSSSWGLSGIMNSYIYYSESSIQINASAQEHSITLSTSSLLSKCRDIVINLNVFYIIDAEIEISEIKAKGDLETVFEFKMINSSDPNRNIIHPDEVLLFINSNPVTEDFFTVENNENLTMVTLNILEYGLASGDHNVTIVALKDGYRKDYDSLGYVLFYSLQIKSGISIPPFVYAIIAISIIVSIITPLFFFIRSRTQATRKLKHDSFKNIQNIYDSVLTINKLILAHSESGLPVFDIDFESAIKIDSALITGFLHAVSTIGGEMIGDGQGDIKRLEYRNFVVTSSKSGYFSFHVFSDSQLDSQLERRISELGEWFNLNFGSESEKENGMLEDLSLEQKTVVKKIMDDLSLWIFFPLYLAQDITDDTNGLDNTSKEVMSFVSSNEQSTVSEILEGLEHVKVEQGLLSLFYLVESKYLIPDYEAYEIAKITF